MKDRPANDTPDIGRHSPDTCKFVGKALTPRLRACGIDVEALLSALELRHASRRAPETRVPRPHGATAPGGATLAAVVEFRRGQK